MHILYFTADGIALGAATSVSQTGLTIIVFVAIMLHKVRMITPPRSKT